MGKDAEARLAALHALCRAIAACDPRDAAILLAAALEDLGAGPPPILFEDLHEEAALWAAFASPPELDAYAEAIWRRQGAKPGKKGKVDKRRRRLAEDES